MPGKRGPKPKPWKAENLSFNWGDDEPPKKEE
jgi:hypothetical protein